MNLPATSPAPAGETIRRTSKISYSWIAFDQLGETVDGLGVHVSMYDARHAACRHLSRRGAEGSIHIINILRDDGGKNVLVMVFGVEVTPYFIAYWKAQA